MINGEVAISVKNFPDEIFKNHIAKYIDEDKSGTLSNEEIGSVQTYPLNGLGITSLQGIEVFYNLVKLSCTDNQLTDLDLSNNRKLKTVDCSRNMLTRLNLSGTKRLENLRCDRNQLTELDLSNNLKLRNLICTGNLLTSLDLSENYWLDYVDCKENPLKILDLSHARPELRNAQDEGVVVDTTYKEANNGPAIDATNFPDETFRDYVLSVIDQDENGILSEQEMRWTLSIEVYGLSDPALIGLQYFTALEELTIEDSNLTKLDVSRFRELTTLKLKRNQLTELDVSKNIELEFLYCSENALTELDVSRNKELMVLDCKGNQLVKMDVSENPHLHILTLSDNQLTELDCSKNLELYVVDCRDNPLERLDVHNCPPGIDIKLGSDQEVNVIYPPDWEKTPKEVL